MNGPSSTRVEGLAGAHGNGRAERVDIDRVALARTIGAALVLSFLVNAIALVPAVYLLQVYDRVLTSGSQETLVTLSIAAVLAVVLGAVLDQVRQVNFAVAGVRLYVQLERTVYAAAHQRSLADGPGEATRPAVDLETVRTFLGGPVPLAFVDLTFSPVLIALLWQFHPWLGVFAAVCMVAAIIIALAFQWLLAGRVEAAALRQGRANTMLVQDVACSQAALGNGMTGSLGQRWAEANRAAVEAQMVLLAGTARAQTWQRGFRGAAQITILAIAASFALTQSVSAGAIIAASIVLARLLQPLDQVIAGLKGTAAARQAWARLKALEAGRPTGSAEHRRGPARSSHTGLVVDRLFAVSRTGEPLLSGISLKAEPGQIVALVGPAGSGKSAVLRCLAGLEIAVGGAMHVGDRPIGSRFSDHSDGLVTYLGHATTLFAGTVGQNISRFQDVQPVDIAAAVDLAGARAVVEDLPHGLDTPAEIALARLSPGQLRRIGLAIAVCAPPPLVILDEPEAHLDRQGEAILARALSHLKSIGSVVVLASHRPATVALADLVVVMQSGRTVATGPASAILKSVVQIETRQASP